MLNSPRTSLPPPALCPVTEKGRERENQPSLAAVHEPRTHHPPAAYKSRVFNYPASTGRITNAHAMENIPRRLLLHARITRIAYVNVNVRANTRRAFNPLVAAGVKDSDTSARDTSVRDRFVFVRYVRHSYIIFDGNKVWINSLFYS